MHMNSIETQLPGSVLLIEGEVADMPHVMSYLAAAGIAIEANPDFHAREFRQFGIDDAADLKARASARAIGERRVFVIAASSITSEAQNALLKTLEEPSDNALFVFVVPAPEALLPTVRSRSQRVTLPRTKGIAHPPSAETIDPGAFYSAGPAGRIDMLKAVLEKGDDDKYDTGAILAFLRALEKYASHIADANLRAAALEPLYKARGYLADRGALIKTLLESIALLSPQL